MNIVKVSVTRAREILSGAAPSEPEIYALAQYRIDGAVMEQALEEPKRFKAVFSTFSRSRTVFIRATSIHEAAKIAKVVEDVYRKARPGAIAIEHLIMTNDVQTPTPELTLEEAILWALNQE